jgi:site-specific DNA recombinase
MKALLYLRVSGKRQADNGVGIDLQERACRQLCELRGWEIAGVFTELVVPGPTPIKKRPVLGKLLTVWATLPEDERVVVAYDLKRIARRSRMILELIDPKGEYRLSITAATQPFDTTTAMGRAVIGIMAVLAELDWEEIRDRNRHMQVAAKARGARWGYPRMMERVVRDPRTGKARYETDPALVARIAKVQRAYATGKYTHQTLAKHLNDTGVPSTRGKRWHSRSVALALSAKLAK